MVAETVQVNDMTIREIRRSIPGSAEDGGMTQEEFAAFMGVAVATVSRWENDHFKPSRLARSKIEAAIMRQRVVQKTGGKSGATTR